MTIVEFLTARLDEDEQVANRAIEGPWVQPAHTPTTVRSYDGGAQISDGGPWGEANAEHIARHDPARVLRGVEAIRRLIAEYEKEARVMEEGHRTGWTEGGQAARETALRLIASVYADHPDYDEALRP